MRAVLERLGDPLAQGRDSVREQLQRDDGQQRLQERVRAGTKITSSASCRMASFPFVATATTGAPWARVSWMFETSFSCTWLSVATQMTGVDSSSSAMGPCFISPAE